MNEKVNEYLERRKSEIAANEACGKEKLLMELGLYEKVYAPDGTIDFEEYPCSEYDNSTARYRYYKEVAIEVTDEEYKEILKYSEKSSDQDRHGAAAIALCVIAWICITAGAIAGFTQVENSILIAVLFWVGGLISGMVFLGFSEVIKLLEDIRREIRRK